MIDDLTERGIDIRFFYSEYIKFLRNLMILKSEIEIEKLHNLNPENISKIKLLIKGVKEIELLRYFNAVKDMELTFKNTENPKIILEYLFIKLSYFPSLMSIEELIEKAGKTTEEKGRKAGNMQVKNADRSFSGSPVEFERQPPVIDEKGMDPVRPKKEQPEIEEDMGKSHPEKDNLEKLKKDKQIKNLTSKIQGRIISIDNLEGD